MHNNLHVAIIMDGNGRWAQMRGLPRTDGHERGARSIREVIKAAPALGIGTLTLYAFSSDNWNRPAQEVSFLMSLLKKYLQSETAKCVKDGVRISFIGRRDRLPTSVIRFMASAEMQTAGCDRLHLRIAVDYSGRESIARTAALINGKIDVVTLSNAIAACNYSVEAVRDVDLVIRTGGEQRLSDFLLWESAYAELYFTKVKWPDFRESELRAALAEFRSRERRFGRVGEPLIAS